jgi:hypothetical protein
LNITKLITSELLSHKEFMIFTSKKGKY